MASQDENGRLRQIAAWWASLPEPGREAIYTLTKALVESQSLECAWALGVLAEAMTQESPDNANATL